MKVKIYIGEEVPQVIDRTLYKSTFTVFSEPLLDSKFSFKAYPNFPETDVKVNYEIDFSTFPKPPTYTNTEMAKAIALELSNNIELDVVYVSGNTFTVTPTNGSQILDFTRTSAFISKVDNTPTVETVSELITEYEVLDMFNDEKVELKNQLGDIEKLSNIFTDYTNSFTVPANEHNNRIFKHYYDIDIDNTFNANIRVKSYIEVDGFPLRFGTTQLEGIKMVKMNPDNYRITFYGNLVQLTELFGEDTIDMLDYDRVTVGSFDTFVKRRSMLSQFDFDYNFNNIISSINNPTFKDGNVITPMIAYANRDWQYKVGGVTDITTTGGAVLATELRQALKVARIIEAMEVKYNIKFTTGFLKTALFNQLFIWMNKRTTDVIGDPSLTTFTGTFTGTPNAGNVSLANNVFSVTREIYRAERADLKTATIRFNIDPVDDLILYTVILQSDTGKELQRWENVKGNKSFVLGWNAVVSTTENLSTTKTEKIRMLVQSNKTMTYTTQVLSQYFKGGTFVTNVTLSGNVNTNAVRANVKDNLSKMKVTDFFQGIMKMFKLVIRPISERNFYLDTLDEYYREGDIIDITDYVDQNEVNIERPKIYSKVEFLFEKTNNLLGKTFREMVDPFNKIIGYGDLVSKYEEVKNKEELSVKLPFENMMFERMNNSNTNTLTDLVIGQSVSSSDNISFKANDGKPFLFFNNGLVGSPESQFKLNFVGEDIDVKYFPLIGNTNDEIFEQVTDTLNWGAEIDPWHLRVVEQSLYKNYWSNWMGSIYDLKQRKIGFDAVLPTSLVDTLDMNDSLIIGSNRYRINDFTTDLTSGETRLNLFNDIYKWDANSFNEPPTISTQLLSRSSIKANAGLHYYGIKVLYDIPWTVSKVSTGFGTDWINIINSGGEGIDECVFRIETKAMQIPPTVYQSRTMNLVFSIGGFSKTVTITQEGLIE
jgi:hypothetical protein